MNTLEKLDICEAIIIDVLYGEDFYDIMAHTVLSEERCKEIEALYPVILNDYRKRHNICDEDE